MPRLTVPTPTTANPRSWSCLPTRSTNHRQPSLQRQPCPRWPPRRHWPTDSGHVALARCPGDLRHRPWPAWTSFRTKSTKRPNLRRKAHPSPRALLVKVCACVTVCALNLYMCLCVCALCLGLCGLLWSLCSFIRVGGVPRVKLRAQHVGGHDQVVRGGHQGGCSFVYLCFIFKILDTINRKQTKD